MYTREQWARSMLSALGNHTPTEPIVQWIVAWTLFETNADSGAKYNLLNTTLREEGSTSFNDVGVQNFTSFAQGVDANATTLDNGLYPLIQNALLHNNMTTLRSNMSEVNAELKKWGTGFVADGILSRMGVGLSDEFEGTTTEGVPHGWSDDGEKLTAPNNIQVVLGFRDYILTHNWDHDNWPLEHENGADSLEYSNPAIGKGTSQPFRKSRLEYTNERGVFEGYVGQEYLWLYNAYLKVNTKNG